MNEIFAVIFIFGPLITKYPFPLDVFKIFPLSPVLSNWIMICCSIVFFICFFLASDYFLEFIIFIKLKQFYTIFIQIIFYLPPSSSQNPFTCISRYLKLLHILLLFCFCILLLESLFFHCFILNSLYCCLYVYYFLSNMWFAFNSIHCILAHISRFISGNLIYHFSIASIAFLMFWTYETQLWLFWCFSLPILTSVLIMNLFQLIIF